MPRLTPCRAGHILRGVALPVTGSASSNGVTLRPPATSTRPPTAAQLAQRAWFARVWGGVGAEYRRARLAAGL